MLKQVSNWFNNRRWSFRHSSRFGSGVAEFDSNEGTPQKSIEISGSSLKPVLDNATCNGIEKKEQDMGSPGLTEGGDRYMTLNMVADEGNGHTPCITETREEETKVGSEATTEPTISLEKPKLNLGDGSPNLESEEK